MEYTEYNEDTEIIKITVHPALVAKTKEYIAKAQAQLEKHTDTAEFLLSVLQADDPEAFLKKTTQQFYIRNIDELMRERNKIDRE